MTSTAKARNEDIEVFRTEKIKPKFLDHGKLEVAVYGNMAVVTSILHHFGGMAS